MPKLTIVRLDTFPVGYVPITKAFAKYQRRYKRQRQKAVQDINRGKDAGICIYPGIQPFAIDISKGAKIQLSFKLTNIKPRKV